MSKKTAVFVFLVLACVARAFAASDIVYVSYNGSDANSCARVSPCRTITHALTVVNAGGQVSIVGSGNYDSFTVTKAVIVSAEPGVVATLNVPASANGVTISAGASDRVVIQGLTLKGHGSGVGITVNSAGEVSIENCVSGNFSYALNFTPSAPGSLTVKGGIYGPSSVTGISICCAAGGTAANVVIDGVTIKDGGYAGVNVDGTLVSVTNSSLSGPGTSGSKGILAIHGTAVIEKDVISNYYYGVGGFSTAYLSSNTISGNSYGVFVAGSVFTRGNNTIEGNSVANVDGAMTSFGGQ